MNFPGKPAEPKPDKAARKFDLLTCAGQHKTIEADYLNIGGQHISFWADHEPNDRLIYAVRYDLIETITEQEPS